MSIRTTIHNDTMNILEHIRKMATTDSELNKWLRQHKPNKEGTIVQRLEMEEVADIEKSYQWFAKAGLKDSTDTNHGSTGTHYQHMIDRGWDLLHQARPQVQSVAALSSGF